jgi:AcrR family transcriptional regulator
VSANLADGLEADPPANGTIQTILEAGALCLARLGQDRTSIQVIADAAGLNRTTIYRYFGDRNRLFNAIADYERSRQRSEVAERIREDASLEDALAAIAEVLASAALAFNVPEHLRRHDRGLAQYYGSRGRDRYEWISSLVRPYIARARQTGELAQGLTEDEAVEWAALVLMIIETLPGSLSLDIREPRAVGRAFAVRICQGIGLPRS